VPLRPSTVRPSTSLTRKIHQATHRWIPAEHGNCLIRLSLNALMKKELDRSAHVAQEAAAVAAEITSTRMRGELKSLAKNSRPTKDCPPSETHSNVWRKSHESGGIAADADRRTPSYRHFGACAVAP